MTLPDTKNLQNLRLVANRLKDLVSEVVFLGGTTLDLLITDPMAPRPRPTEDVDLIVEVASHIEYTVKLRDKLIACGFEEANEINAPLCRWEVDGLMVDIMPVDGTIFNLPNRWYPQAMANAWVLREPDWPEIHVISASYFLGTKADAFNDRGIDDPWDSHDLEDFIAIVDGRPTLMEEIRDSETALQEYLAEFAEGILKNPDVDYVIQGFFGPGPMGGQRIPWIHKRLNEISQLA